jgi:hypothetical protein
MGLVVGQQPAVRAATIPSRARGRRFGRLRLPLVGPLLDNREFLADHADVGGLPDGSFAGSPQLYVLAAQAVLDLAGRAGQVGQHEGHIAELGAQRFQRGEHLALKFLVTGLDRGAERRPARVDLPHDHRDVGAQLIGAPAARVQDLPDGAADLRLQAPGQVRCVRRRRTGPAGRPLQKRSQHVGPDRDEHAHPGQAGSRAVGAGQGRPERRRAQHRQHGRNADAAQLVAAASRRPQKPGADTRLKAFNLLKVPHQPPPCTGVTPQDGRSLAGVTAVCRSGG